MAGTACGTLLRTHVHTTGRPPHRATQPHTHTHEHTHSHTHSHTHARTRTCVVAQQPQLVGDERKVCGCCGPARPQAIHHAHAHVEAKPVDAAQGDGLVVARVEHAVARHLERRRRRAARRHGCTPAGIASSEGRWAGRQPGCNSGVRGSALGRISSCRRRPRRNPSGRQACIISASHHTPAGAHHAHAPHTTPTKASVWDAAAVWVWRLARPCFRLWCCCCCCQQGARADQQRNPHAQCCVTAAAAAAAAAACMLPLAAVACEGSAPAPAG
jgi:hypothetical protein